MPSGDIALVLRTLVARSPWAAPVPEPDAGLGFTVGKIRPRTPLPMEEDVARVRTDSGAALPRTRPVAPPLPVANKSAEVVSWGVACGAGLPGGVAFARAFERLHHR